jgi:hypothetical protein
MKTMEQLWLLAHAVRDDLGMTEATMKCTHHCDDDWTQTASRIAQDLHHCWTICVTAITQIYSSTLPLLKYLMTT